MPTPQVFSEHQTPLGYQEATDLRNFTIHILNFAALLRDALTKPGPRISQNAGSSLAKRFLLRKLQHSPERASSPLAGLTFKHVSGPTPLRLPRAAMAVRGRAAAGHLLPSQGSRGGSRLTRVRPARTIRPAAPQRLAW